jgi:hypothetical protein
MMNKNPFTTNIIEGRRARLARSTCLLVCACALGAAFFGCGKDQKQADNKPAATNTQAAGAVDAAQIIERYRAIDDSRYSAIKLRSKIEDLKPAETAAPPVVEMMMYQKREADGSKKMFIEFTAPAQERDRDALIVISPHGDIEGMRYTQSSDNFITSKDPMVEESLFGMTMQELAGGQPDKYDFKLIGEESFNGSPVYRLEGKLKPGVESKFPRLVLLISKENFNALAAEFYDNKNNLSRAITISEAKQIDGHWTRMRWMIDNRSRQKKIEFETLEAKYDQSIPDSIFTPDNLKKKAMK